VTFTLPFFTDLHNRWYTKVNGKNAKVIPSNIAEWITPRALAYWLCGVGSFHKTHGSIVICTDSFSHHDMDLLRSILFDFYGIETTRNVIRAGQYRIRELDPKTRGFKTTGTC
jgi:hypothetical protein